MAYAVIKTGGKQYRVTVGDKLDVEKVDGAAEGNDVTFENVLAAGEGESVRIGAPFLSGASVVGPLEQVSPGSRLVLAVVSQPRMNTVCRARSMASRTSRK